MVFNPMMLNKEQQERLAEVQQYTDRIKAKISLKDNSLIVEFITSDKEAEKYLDMLQDATIESIASVLQKMFAISGTIEKEVT